MNFLDIFTDPLGYKGINEQRRAADRYAKKMYDPKIFNPMVAEAQQQASEGVDDASMRVDYLRRLFAQQPQGQFFGGNQAAYVSGMNALASNMAGSQAGAELQIGMAEEQAKRTARNTLAELFSKQKQTQAQQEAALEENAMMAQAEKNRRFNEFMGGVANLGVSMALAPVTGGTSLGAGLSWAFGKSKNFIGRLFNRNKLNLINPINFDFDEIKDKDLKLTYNTPISPAKIVPKDLSNTNTNINSLEINNPISLGSSEVTPYNDWSILRKYGFTDDQILSIRKAFGDDKRAEEWLKDVFLNKTNYEATGSSESILQKFNNSVVYGSKTNKFF